GGRRIGLLAVAAALVCISWVRVSAREVPITILHTCDLHGNVLPTEDYEGKTNVGGIARCATAIRRVREQEKNVLLVDAGDTLQGTPVSFLTDGQVIVKCLNQLHYDAWTWGNHEFDWGLSKLAACADRAEVPMVVANMRKAKDGGNPNSQDILSRLKPYIVREIDGVKVGIIGLDTPDIPSWSRPRLIEGLAFEDSVDTLHKVIPEVRAAGAQVLVVVCHQGYREGGDDHANQINAIARNFPELDVIIGAHTHRNFPEFKVSQVLYCQADYYGIYLGRVDLVFDTDTGRVVRRKSNTLLMDEQVPLDDGILKLTSAEVERARKVASTKLGEAADEFISRALPRKETPVHDLLFEAIADALREHGVKVDAVVHGIQDRRDGLRKGPITVGDVWKVVPYENTIGTVELLPVELREVLEEDLDAYDNNAFRGIWGLRWTFDPLAEKGQRTLALRRADGSRLDEKQRLVVAFNSYDLASGGQRWKRLRELADRPESKLVEYDFQTREAVINYVRKRGTITPNIANWWVAQHSVKASSSTGDNLPIGARAQ
ncbi:MAG TPA: bifunctional UDP-sugar hydrolase/5'-nucleotidase, partial [Verrucomicrobiae bacterium]|nr:bifunctional UDP-sugar hydrolase/5'-nucleotidase [Verrucomicrobiae bacterium]